MKIIKISTFLYILPLLSLHSREAKEYDNDVNYDESKTPHYDLPKLLVTPEGKKIKSPEEWNEIRRPQILSLFSNLIYGRGPEPSSPIKIDFKVVKEDEDFMKGKATRKDIDISIGNSSGNMTMRFIIFSPNNVEGPAPAFLKHSFNNTRSNDFDASPFRKGKLKNGAEVAVKIQRPGLREQITLDLYIVRNIANWLNKNIKFIYVIKHAKYVLFK